MVPMTTVVSCVVTLLGSLVLPVAVLIVFAAKNITKQYRKARSREKFNALADFHMEVYRGDIYGFVGENGAGKTTLMRILTGRSEQNIRRKKHFVIVSVQLLIRFLMKNQRILKNC